jgi:hypothetical protein
MFGVSQVFVLVLRCMLTLSARFLGFYQNIGSVLYPVLSNIPRLERQTRRLLDNRRRAGGVYKPNANGLVKPFGMDLPFLSLLFAVLASGCQLSDFPESDRELTSWVYGASHSRKIARAVLTFHSFLCVPMSSDVELCVATHNRSNSDPSHH